jgi:hypothetical protein
MLLLLFYLLVPPTHGSYCTATDFGFDGYRYQENIPHCKREVTTQKKIEICKRDGVVDRTDFTVDHIIPLSLGGSNNDDNLWCQHKSLNVTSLEYEAFKEIQSGESNQKEAVEKVLQAKFSKGIYE